LSALVRGGARAQILVSSVRPASELDGRGETPTALVGRFDARQARLHRPSQVLNSVWIWVWISVWILVWNVVWIMVWISCGFLTTILLHKNQSKHDMKIHKKFTPKFTPNFKPKFTPKFTTAYCLSRRMVFSDLEG